MRAMDRPPFWIEDASLKLAPTLEDGPVSAGAGSSHDGSTTVTESIATQHGKQSSEVSAEEDMTAAAVSLEEDAHPAIFAAGDAAPIATAARQDYHKAETHFLCAEECCDADIGIKVSDPGDVAGEVLVGPIEASPAYVEFIDRNDSFFESNISSTNENEMSNRQQQTPSPTSESSAFGQRLNQRPEELTRESNCPASEQYRSHAKRQTTLPTTSRFQYKSIIKQVTVWDEEETKARRKFASAIYARNLSTLSDVMNFCAEQELPAEEATLFGAAFATGGPPAICRYLRDPAYESILRSKTALQLRFGAGYKSTMQRGPKPRGDRPDEFGASKEPSNEARRKDAPQHL